MKRVVAGRNAVTEALRGRTEVAVIYAEHPEDGALRDLSALARQKRVRIEARTREELERLADGVRHQGVVAIAGQFQYCKLEDIDSARLLVALDQVTDPHNFGAIVRSAAAFGAGGVIVTKDRCAPVTAVVVRASAGATEHVPIAQVTNLARSLSKLKERGFEVIGLAGESEESVLDLPPATAADHRVLCIGSEGSGLRRLTRKACDRVVRIPMTATLDSLNASVAAGVALFALSAGALSTSGSRG